MAEITPDKLELLRVALPKGLSAGDSGLAGFPERPLTQPTSWPQFQATTTDTKLYTDSPEITEGAKQLGSQREQPCAGFSLYKKIVGNSTQVWVNAGTVNGQTPSGMNEDGVAIAGSGSGSVWVELNIDEDNGDVVSVAVSGGGATPNNTDTSFYYALGQYSYDDDNLTITNYGCGSLTAVICRNFYRANPPFYGVSFYR